MRLFVAVELDRGMQRALARTWESQPELAGTLKAATRLVAEEQIHLTIRFVGETDDDRIADVIEAAEVAAAAVPAFAFVVRGLGCFPKPQLARVVWAGIEPCPPLQTLARRVEQELRDRAFPPEPRGFSPHVTLGRAKGAPARLDAPLDAERPRFGEQQVDELTIFESRLSPRGAIYVPVAHAPLADPTPPDADAGDASAA